MNCSLNMNLSLLNNGAITTKNWCSCVSFSSFPSSSSSHQKFHQNPLPKLALINLRSFGRMSNGRCTVNVRQNTATTNSSFPSPSSWDDKPFEVLPNGRVMYLDEQDVVTFLDPPKELIPLDPSTYNPASYLWKKIEDIPEERRHRLLRLLDSRLLSRAWEIAGTRYDDPKLIAKTASGLLSDGKDEVLIHGKDEMPLEFWNCRTNGGPAPIAWMNYFKKALFYSKERNQLYGRFIGGSFLEGISNSFAPLYFTVARDLNEVISTEQPCDLAYEFGEGLLDISVYPDGFPKPAKHPWPFNDEVVVYIRQVGPGVLVGQAWQEGVAMEQLPKKLCGDILMVKDYFSSITADASEATGGP
ncbi:OLC1v1010098C1 [Oldenlandia corymbosa var. corymbosa]|uniref:OLC1v1010098C1 n=1 Tax=Oldenlandia corymbosa var. corymbosa TaxID=529605 RepID=A0AAV1DSW2_OLDCO|nr:OLC1v1010098C1 [Oldenlandia corymbosa var. corymbosa]